MRKILQKIPLLLLLINISLSQEVDISKYLYLLRAGDVERVKSELDSLKKVYPNSVNLKFLEANLTENGEEAVKIYYDIALNHLDNEFSDESLFKVFQFHYAKGDYEQARKELERLKSLYPSSPYAGIKIRFPVESETKSVASKVKCNYSLQVGAFADRNNAEMEKKFFESNGYPVEIHTKFKDGKLLYLVHVGCFSDRKDADMARDDIKKKFKRESFVVSSEEVK